MKIIGLLLWLVFVASIAIATCGWLGYGWAQVTGAVLGPVIWLVVVAIAIASLARKISAKPAKHDGGDAS